MYICSLQVSEGRSAKQSHWVGMRLSADYIPFRHILALLALRGLSGLLSHDLVLHLYIADGETHPGQIVPLLYRLSCLVYLIEWLW